MRTKDVLLDDFENIKILYQYLYMENTITYSNGVTTLKLRMDDDLHIFCTNMRFPDLPEMLFDEQMTLNYTLDVISVLAEMPSDCGYGNFTSKWNEIETITKSNLGLNYMHRRS